MTPPDPNPPLTDTLRRDWLELCPDGLDRRAGSRRERKAAAWIAKKWQELGLTVRQDSFPCRCLLDTAETSVEAQEGTVWKAVEARCLVGSSSTRGAGLLEGEMIWLDMPEDHRRIRRENLEGSIALWTGPLPIVPEHYRRLIQCRPRALIHVDDRLPFAWPKDDGIYPFWVRRHGAVPTISVPYQDAWRWRRDGVQRLRIRVKAPYRAGRSINVEGILPGTDPDLPDLVLTAHHDTQCNNSGADDNGSGVVALIALARLLAPLPRLRTIRFISFGAEEQLSVGSLWHVRSRSREPQNTGLVINFDSVGSPLGHFTMHRAGHASLGAWFRRGLARRGVNVQETAEVVPFADHFPFTVTGIPAIWFMRENSGTDSRWQHHSCHDHTGNVDPVVVEGLLRALIPLVAQLGSSMRWPFPRHIPASYRSTAVRFARDLYGWRVRER